jgi:6,7-dimethyl-8-ribityllumazine synthase
MYTQFEGQLIGTGLKIGIVCSRFNELVTSKLLSGALDSLVRHGVAQENVTVCWVPGAFEIPMIASKMARTGRFDAVVCLGAVIRGATIHFELVAAETAKGIASVGLATQVPCIFGVIAADSIDQALERAGSKAGNKGWEAAQSAIEMANVMRALGG